MKKRIDGIDLARALAIFGMIIVNFKTVFSPGSTSGLATVLSVLDGKSAATFVVLAGVGISLMTKNAILNKKLEKLKTLKITLLKRAVFLFVVGISYLTIWEADILHYYGIYLIFAIILLSKSSKTLFFSALSIVFFYPLLFLFLNYDTGWDYNNMEYINLWNLSSFIRHLFFNGFHPVLPWVAFMLCGMWFGKKDLNNPSVIKKGLYISLGVFVVIQATSYFSINLLSNENALLKEELTLILGTNPMPPLPFYMISGCSIALFFICFCISMANKFKDTYIIAILKKTGQLAFTYYIAHIVVGIGFIALITPNKIGTYSITFSFIYALFFMLGCICFAYILNRYKKQGPIEWLMRKICG